MRKQNSFLVLLGDEPGWKHDQIGSDGIERVGPSLRLQAQPLEPVNQIERQKHQLKERHVGSPGLGRDFAQRIIVKHFPVVFFDDRTRIVKEVDPPGVEVKIGDKNMVDVLFVLEQFELPGFDRVLRNRAPHHHEAMELVPVVMDFVPEFGHLPPIGQRLEAARPGSPFERPVFFGHHDVSTARPVDKLDNGPAIEPRIHPETDSGTGDRGRRFVETGLDKMPGSCRGNGVPRPEHPMPEFLPMRFEAEDRVIGTAAMLLGVVSDLGSLLFAVHRDHDRVDIERQAAGEVRQSEQMGAQAVVKPTYLANRFGRQTLQEPAQRGLVREALETQHFQEGSVVLQDLGLVDAPETHDDGVEQCQKQFGILVGATARSRSNIALKEALQPQFVAKTLNQPHPAEVGNVCFLEGNTDFSGAFWHVTQNTLLGRFVSWGFLRPVQSSYPSIFQKTGWPGMAPFAHN